MDYQNLLFIIDMYNRDHNTCSIIEYENALCELFETDEISFDIKLSVLDKYNLQFKKDQLSNASFHLVDENGTVIVSLYDVSKTILNNLMIK